MVKKSLILLFVLFSITTAKSQNLNWHLSAQAGATSHQFENFQGSLLAGFENLQGQQLSVGPVFKGYTMNTEFKNALGGRIYSQAKVYNDISLYIQCDIFDGTRSISSPSVKSPMRLETGAGIIYTYRQTIGLSAGYNIGELNPISGIRKNSPAIKLVYLMPIGYRGW